MAMTEEGPVARDVAFEEGKFGENEEPCEICQCWKEQGRRYSPLRTIRTTCSQASKKKNLETTKVLTSMTELAAMTANRAIMLITRMTLSTT
jgi:hypothetical protein